MGSSDKLFMLVASLSKGEKLHFKRFAARHERSDGNSYIKLFNIINSQSKNGEYDEKKVKEQFTGSRSLGNFPVLKSYLYENILQSLNAAKKDDAGTFLKHARILYARGLYAQSIEVLKKAKNLAEKEEDYNILLSILEVEYNLGIKFLVGNQREKLATILKEEEAAAKKILNLNRYKYYLTQMPVFTSNEILIRNQKERDIAKNYIRSDPMLANDKSISKRAQFLYFMIRGMSHYTLGEYRSAYKYFQKQLLLIESTYSLRKHIDNYALILYDFMYMAILLKQFSEVPELLVKFEKLLKHETPKLTKTTRLISYFYFYLIKLELMIQIADFIGSDEVLAEAEDFINNNLNEFSEFPSLIFSLATVYFAKGDYDNALLWNNKILNEFYDSKSDITVGARILSIFIHYELNNIEFLQYSVRSLYHYLIKNNKAYKFETYLISFIRRLPNVKTNDDFIFQLSKLRKQLYSIRNNPYESRVFFEYFDYIAWIDSKLTNRLIADIIKEKNIIVPKPRK